MNLKRWNILTQNERLVNELKDELAISELSAKILINRGYTDTASARKFLNTAFDNVYDPFLMRDMDCAVNRICEAIDNGEKIVIYGDYDVDGITSAYILYDYLKSKGAEVSCYLPDRKSDGYGLNINVLNRVRSEGISLVITVDNGSSSVNEVNHANEIGLDVVITDHHECPEDGLPNAAAIVNPKRNECEYPFKELAGVGVTFKVICAVEIFMEEDVSRLCGKYLPFVTLGTVGDIMPLEGENRIFVHHGLRMFEKSLNTGIKSLIKNMRVNENKIDTSIISFSFVPKLNAAGRMANAERALELFLSDSEEYADYIADELNNLNRSRQYTEIEIFKKAVSMIENKTDRYDNFIYLYEESWDVGIIGIVASKLAEKYGKTVMLVTKEADVCKGSIRSCKGINAADALAFCREYFIKHGGHEAAGGFSFAPENLNIIGEKLDGYIGENKIDDTVITYNLDCEIKTEELTVNTFKSLNLLEPFGVKNETPIFALTGLVIENILPLKDNKHLKIILRKDKKIITALYFNISREAFVYEIGDTVDLACNIGIDNYRNTESLKFVIRDMRNTDADIDYSAKLYTLFCKGEEPPVKTGDIPDKSDFAYVYNFIKANTSILKSAKISYFNLYKIIKRTKDDLSYFKFRVILDVFCGFELITLKNSNNLILSITLNNNAVKVNLEDSPLLKKLQK